MRKKGKRKLTSQQRLFVAEYLVDRNATRAAKASGYSKKSAESLGCRLVKDPQVFAAIAARSEKIDDRLAITAENIRREYARLAFADASHVMTWGPDGVTLKRSWSLSEDDRRAVAEVTQTVSAEGGSIRLRMHDKKGALDALAKHMGLFDALGKTKEADQIPDVINLGDDDSHETAENYPDDYTQH